MKRKQAYLLSAAVAGLVLEGGAGASDTVTYRYDALGRLIAVVTSGGPNNGQQVSTSYDPAGNRSNYSVGTGGGTPPPPPPPPPPSNSPPMTSPDMLQVAEWTGGVVNVLANDSDPDGDSMTVTAISGGGGYAYISTGSTIGWNAAPAGTYTVTYTVTDSRGATATGTLTVESIAGGGECGFRQLCE